MQEDTGFMLGGEGFTYDRYGNMNEKMMLFGYKMKYSGIYDSEGNLKSSTVFTTDDGARTAVMTYTHDGLGNTVTAKTTKSYFDRQTTVTTTRIYDYTKDVPTVLYESSTDISITGFFVAHHTILS